jgi:uncharacterized protein (TIGR02246 family)
MNLKRLGLAACCAAALAASWLAIRPISAQGSQSEEAAIREVFDKQTAAWNRGDTAAFMDGYWKSPDTEFAGVSGMIRGWDNVMARYRRVYPDARAMGHLSFDNIEIRVLCPEAAYATGEFKLERETGQLSGIYTVIVKKFPEGWRAIHDHTTAYPPPATDKKQ